VLPRERPKNSSAHLCGNPFPITGRKVIGPTIRQHIANWLEAEQGTIESCSVKRYRQVLGHFESFLGARVNAPLEALSKEVFLEYREHLQKSGHSPRNINQIFNILARPFRVAADERLIQHNPIGAIKRLRSVSAEKGIFTGKQINKLLTAAPDDEWRALIALGYYTGSRPMDLARLTWAAVDREKQAITFQQKKTGGVVVIPIHPELARYLDTLKPGIGRAPMLPKLSIESGTGKSGLSNSFRKIMDVAGIEPVSPGNGSAQLDAMSQSFPFTPCGTLLPTLASGALSSVRAATSSSLAFLSFPSSSLTASCAARY